MPTEFNPMRFAGWCCTDVSYFAFGFYTYDYYFRTERPDWQNLVKDKAGNYFDYARACDGLGTVLCLRRMDDHKEAVYGFLFTEIGQEDKAAMQRTMERDSEQYLLP